MKLQSMSNTTMIEITQLIDNIFNQTMRVGYVADEKYIDGVLFQSKQKLPEIDEKCKELLSKTAASLKEDLSLYVDLKLEMCNRIIDG